MKNTKINIILAGVGGQGTVLASKLIAGAALEKGYIAHTAETIGMAQRGGSVVSHVRIGECYSPLIPTGLADMIIGFEPAEALRNINYLKEGGVVIASSKAIKPVTASLTGDKYDGTEQLAFLRENIKNLAVIDGDAICAECGSPKVLNIALLGAAARFSELGLTYDELRLTLIAKLPPKILDMNLKALRMGNNKT